jgi:hypothetical protein
MAMSKALNAGVAAVIVGLMMMLSPAQSREEIPAETRLFRFDANLHTCDSAEVLSTIQSRFNAAEQEYWGGAVEIVGFEKSRQAAFRPHGLDLIPRRYCQATALLSNNRKAVVRYAIIEDYGFAGLWDGVSFCVAGYDRNHTANPGCARVDR